MKMLQTPSAESLKDQVFPRPRSKASCATPGMRAVFVTILFLLNVGATMSWAQVKTSQPPVNHEHRYLLVVDTSKAMQSREQNTLQAVEDLLYSGMDGQIKDGDVLAVWTYNDEVFAGTFPIQRWSAAEKGTIISRVLTHLRNQKPGKVGDLSKALQAMSYVVRESDFLTMIVMTDGEQKIRGTLFDKNINDFCERQEKKQRKAKMPIVIAMRSINGQVTEYAVSLPPRLIRIPQVPVPPPVEPATAELAKAAETPKVSVETIKAPPGALIFAGSSPKPIVVKTPVEITLGKPETGMKADPPLVPTVAATPVITPVPQPVIVETTQAVAAAIAPAVPAPTAPMAVLPDAAPSESGSAINFMGEIAKTEATQSISSPTVPAPTAVAPAIATPTPVQVAAVIATQVSPPVPPIKVEVPKSAPALAVKAVPAPAVSIASVPASVTNVPVGASVRPTDIRPVKARPHPHMTVSPPHAQTAMVAPAAGWINGWIFWAAALVLVATTFSCSLIIVRRSRPVTSVSLITSSFERNKRG